MSGYARLWNVAFPNDGSQGDKAYYDEENRRPPIVLFANMAAIPEASHRPVNGVLVPVEDDELSRLRKRELRYHLVDITEHFEPYAEAREQLKLRRYRASGFVGREVFTQEEDVKRGVIPRSYMDTVLRGVSFWEERARGFEGDYHASTIIPPETEITPLRRVDL